VHPAAAPLHNPNLVSLLTRLVVVDVDAAQARERVEAVDVHRARAANA